MKRHTTQQKAHSLTQWQANKLKIIFNEIPSSKEYITLINKFKNKIIKELML